MYRDTIRLLCLISAKLVEAYCCEYQKSNPVCPFGLGKFKLLGYIDRGTISRAGSGISGSRVPEHFSGTRTQNLVRVPENSALWVVSIINHTCKIWVLSEKLAVKSFLTCKYNVVILKSY